MEVVFADDSLTGEIRLTAPQLLSNGHPRSGQGHSKRSRPTVSL